jgi:hypothetical protein
MSCCPHCSQLSTDIEQYCYTCMIRAQQYRSIKKGSSTLGIEVRVGAGVRIMVRISVWIRVIVIVNPLQPNTLLHIQFMALQRQ